MPQKKKTQTLPKQFVSRSPDFRTIYATGAFGHPSPFDYRLAFYTHEPQYPKEPEATTNVKVSQVFQVEIIMSYHMMKRLRDLLDRQLKQTEKTQASKEKGE